MKEKLDRKVITCPDCGATYLPDEEVCACTDEPVVNDWRSLIEEDNAAD